MNKQSEDADTSKKIKDLKAQAFELMMQLTDEQIEQIIFSLF